MAEAEAKLLGRAVCPPKVFLLLLAQSGGGIGIQKVGGWPITGPEGVQGDYSTTGDVRSHGSTTSWEATNRTAKMSDRQKSEEFWSVELACQSKVLEEGCAHRRVRKHKWMSLDGDWTMCQKELDEWW